MHLKYPPGDADSLKPSAISPGIEDLFLAKKIIWLNSCEAKEIDLS